MTDNTELKQAAQRIVEVQTSQDVPIGIMFDEFEALASPEAVLALIAENDRLNAENKQFILLECYGGTAQAAINLLAERDQLKAENEALRKDAGKWKTVESAMNQLQSDERGASIWSVCSRLLISVAQKLNSSVSTVTEEGVTIGDVEVGDWRVTVERVKAPEGLFS